MCKNFLMLTVFFILLASPLSLKAASDGELGETSSGTADISMGVTAKVQISDMPEVLDFGTYSGSGDLNQTDDVCVWTNVSNGTYKVTASGSGTEGAFTVARGETATVAYQVWWRPSLDGGVEYVQLESGEASASQSGANTESPSCSSGGKSATFKVLFKRNTLLSSPPGEYRGTLSLMIAPP